ncbi:UDP binding domain-containing protein, partial [Actinomadura sp. 9N407]|uniref:UDP binding domain-containing protein n=1 Tax=Actinomadura sp. 9N407 TaxID=3375154 RepID=UPI00379141CF
MPRYIVERAQQLLNTHGQALKNAHILLLGVTYKADIADQRETPARPIARRLTRLGAHLTYHDPHVKTWEVDGNEVPSAGPDLVAALESADLVIVLAEHAAYDAGTLTRHSRLLFDTRGRTRDSRGETVELL